MAKRVLVTGATGQLGAYVVRELVKQEVEVVAWGHSRPGSVFGVSTVLVDLAKDEDVRSAFHDARPDVVIHAAAMAAVADCVRDPVRAEAVNVHGTTMLSRMAAAACSKLVYVSTDLVFNGEHAPYVEMAEPHPLSVYGQTKAAGEAAVLALAHHAVVRVSLLYGPSLSGRPSFFDHQLAAIRNRQPVRLFEDEWRTPGDLATAATALVAMAHSDVSGVFHVGGPERMSRVQMGQRLARYLGIESAAIESSSRLTATGEPRPRDTSLDSSRWRELFPQIAWPRFEQALIEMGVCQGRS